MEIGRIKVNNRFRKDLGNIKTLASSIVALGLMHPVVINESNQLIAGQRRLEACKLLGWKEIPVTVINIKDLLAGELHENIARKDFTMSERVEILDEIEKQRIGHKLTKAKGDKLSPFQIEHKSKKSRSIVSEYTGISEGQLSKEKLIIKTLHENPSQFRDLIPKIDKGTLSVDRAYKEVQDFLWKEKQIASNVQLNLSVQQTTAGDKIKLLEGDFRKVVPQELKDSSVHLIFTDPPYDKPSVHLYADLAKQASRVLRPGGSLVMYYGQYALIDILGQIYASVNSELRYWWQFCIMHQGPFARYFDRQIVVKWKPLLWFVKGSRPINPSFPKSKKDGKKSYIADLIISRRPEKRFHDWEQNPLDAEYVLRFLTAENDLVLDPFVGGGSTAIACMNLHRRFIGIDIDPKTLESARANINMNTQK